MRFLQSVLAFLLLLSLPACSQWSAAYYTSQGDAHLVKGDYDKAIQDYNQAISRDPKSARALAGRGAAYLDKGDYDAAIGRFEDATRYQPKLALPWELLGEAWEKKHDKEKALDAYKKFLELLPQGGDSDRVRKRVAKLQDDLAREARRGQ